MKLFFIAGCITGLTVGITLTSFDTSKMSVKQHKAELKEAYTQGCLCGIVQGIKTYQTESTNMIGQSSQQIIEKIFSHIRDAQDTGPVFNKYYNIK